MPRSCGHSREGHTDTVFDVTQLMPIENPNPESRGGLSVPPHESNPSIPQPPAVRWPQPPSLPATERRGTAQPDPCISRATHMPCLPVSGHSHPAPGAPGKWSPHGHAPCQGWPSHQDYQHSGPKQCQKWTSSPKGGSSSSAPPTPQHSCVPILPQPQALR